jgi:hypothetical protein
MGLEVSIIMDKKNKTKTVGREEVRRRLGGLSVEEIEDAVTSGLLIRLPDRRFDAESVAFAEAYGEDWHKSLNDERRLNATEAAKRLGVSVTRFRNAVKAEQIEHVSSIPWKYGVIKFYRGADVDALADWLMLDAADRHVSSVSKRSDAARKGVETRRRNAEAAKAARQVLLAVEPVDGDSSVMVVKYVAAMLTGFRYNRGAFGEFGQYVEVENLAKEFVAARFSEEEKLALWSAWQGRGLAARQELARAKNLNALMGLPPGTLPNDLPHLGGWVSQSEAELWVQQNPTKIEEACARERERRFLDAANRVIEAELIKAQRESDVLEAITFLASRAPSDDDHPTVRLRLAVEIVTALDGDVEGVAEEHRTWMDADSFRTEEILQCLPRDIRRKELAIWQARALEAKRDLIVLRSPKSRRAQRIAVLESHGLAHYGNWVVQDEVDAILREVPDIARKWLAENAAEDRRIAARNERRRNKKLGRRQRWAEALRVPVDAVPNSVHNPTERAIRAAEKYPPYWLMAARKAQNTQDTDKT